MIGYMIDPCSAVSGLSTERRNEMRIVLLTAAFTLAVLTISPAKAFDYSFSNQDFTDQNNNMDNVCFVDNMMVPC